MSPLTKAKKIEVPKRNISKIFLPVYIVLSALFILYVGYSYLQGVVYTSWNNTGQQQWYQAAYVEIITAVSEKCEPVALNAWETQISIVNVACLQWPEQETQGENPGIEQ